MRKGNQKMWPSHDDCGVVCIILTKMSCILFALQGFATEALGCVTVVKREMQFHDDRCFIVLWHDEALHLHPNT